MGAMGCHRRKRRGGRNMPMDKGLISGSTAMLLLRLLSEKDMYGYEMIETLRQRSQNVFELKAGTLYPLLHSMEEKNLLTVYEREAGGKVRKYYSITKEGRGVLSQKKAEWESYARAVARIMEMRKGTDACPCNGHITGLEVSL